MSASGKDFYELLGVSKDSTNSQIKKAFLVKCKTAHPDRGGDPEKFKELKHAYETLMDEQKRKIYDRYGLEGLKKQEQGGHPGFGGQGDLGDILARTFGFDADMGMGGGGRDRTPRGEDIQFRLGVSLPDLYTGKSVPLKFKRRECCHKCKGSGATKPGASSTCNSCGGHGVKTVMRSLGRGMVQQFRTQCPECHGEGICIDRKFLCKECNGQRIGTKNVEINAEIPAGTMDGEKITLKKEGHQEPDGLPGNVILHIKQVESQNDPCPFERKGNDLILDKTINLAQAICGYRIVIEHMDGRKLTVVPEPDAIVHPNGMHIVRDEGMPRRENKHLRGHLYIRFKVTFPPSNQITPELREEIRKLLPEEALNEVPQGTEEVEAVEWNHRTDPAPGTSDGTSSSALYSSSDDDQQQGATCVHQ